MEGCGFVQVIDYVIMSDQKCLYFALYNWFSVQMVVTAEEGGIGKLGAVLKLNSPHTPLVQIKLFNSHYPQCIYMLEPVASLYDINVRHCKVGNGFSVLHFKVKPDRLNCVSERTKNICHWVSMKKQAWGILLKRYFFNRCLPHIRMTDDVLTRGGTDEN